MELEDFSESLARLADSLSDEGLEGVMTDLGVEAKTDLMLAAKRDLGGDNRFSGWKRVSLTSGFEHTGRGEIKVSARLPGPWSVAEQGRHGGRKNGNTRPKYTWTEGMKETEEETPQRLKLLLDKLIGRFL